MTREKILARYHGGMPFKTLDQAMRNRILAALKLTKGNRVHTAILLDVSVRTLRNWINGSARKNLLCAGIIAETAPQPLQEKVNGTE